MRNCFTKLGLVMLVLMAFAATAVADTTALNADAVDGILVFESEDSAFKWWFDARAYIDVATYFDDAPLYDPDSGDYSDYEDFAEMQNSLPGGVILRRARIALKSQLWHNWYGEVDLDFAEEGAAVKDAYISYNGIFGGNGTVRVGNFRQPNGLEEVTTSRNLMFMERSQGTEPFVVGRRMGLELAGWGSKLRGSASVFGADVDEFVKEANEQINFAARVNWAPIQTDESTLVIGASGALRKPTFIGEFEGEKDPSKVKLNTRPESNVSDTKFVYAGIKDVKDFSNYGLELAYVNKRFMVQSEYMGASVNRFASEDPDDNRESISYYGGYAFASFFLTDDQRKYDHRWGEFDRVVPSSSSGAWEVAVRYSGVDLNDHEADQMNGKSNSFTLGVNYYPNANVKMMLNYGVVNNDIFATGKDDQFFGDYDFSYLQMRFQTAF